MHMLIGHLHDFTHRLPRRPGGEASNPALALMAPAAPVAPSAAAARPAANPGPDLTAIAAQATAEGRLAGEAEARIAYERQRSEDMARTEERIAQERLGWVEQESERLAAAIDSGLVSLREELADSLARVIGPFLLGAVREQALAEMATLINDTLSGGDAPVMRVTGAPDLIEQLRGRIDPRAPVTFEPGPESEVVVVAGATTLETQIQAWAARLGAVGE
ncbi:hypothetical protein [Ancylobacter radicis]|uniref:Flagellar assembly protein FliH/Type III secretion system HrpE domain-containing protein n=1 Tax=Ancylobacter radicis TaxID=2836179 RepID=A0ABS5RCD3_9HYPH|nr:hypothetical protein [Ancylobacter radicis]MBS9479325.1 hypothetical protein [Ancylobacter radicis]